MSKLGVEDEDELGLVQQVVVDPTHNIILLVRLESTNPNRRRYLVILSAPFSLKKSNKNKNQLSPTTSNPVVSPTRSQDLDYCLLGVDAIYNRDEDGNEELSSVTIGFVLKMLWGSKVSLDGDGGFSVHQLGRHFVFKPSSVQALWTAIQTLHLTSSKLKPKRHSLCLGSYSWVADYEQRVDSPQSAINEWNFMPDILSRRAPSPDELSRLTADEVDQETKKVLVKSKLREIMKAVDLDNITSKSIRSSLESELVQKLDDFKAFIDEEILLILGQMDPASRIFDFLYLGSEWNASNLEELSTNGVTHILNVTREIDNFFPSVFQYLNIREYDVEETDLLKYWDKTYLFIKNCLLSGGKVLVHCKMGISRSASTVCSFAMKYFDWSMAESLDHVHRSRSIINPNSGFRNQLQVYEGILAASKKRNTFRKQRSKSESNASARPSPSARRRSKRSLVERWEQTYPGSSLTAAGLTSSPSPSGGSGPDVCDNGFGRARPKSWSPSDSTCLDNDCSGSARVPIMCHCYSQLSLYFNKNHVKTSHIGGSLKKLSDDLDPGVVEATNLKNRLMPLFVGEEKDCPAQSHIDQCTCNLELELKVSESPVEVSTLVDTPETDLILRNLSNFPIHLRQSQTWNNVAFRDVTAIELDNEDSRDTVNEDDNFRTFRLDTSGAEELSVKTLADMFDFKLGEEPSKPPLTARHNKLVESKIENIAKKLSIADIALDSEC